MKVKEGTLPFSHLKNQYNRTSKSETNIGHLKANQTSYQRIINHTLLLQLHNSLVGNHALQASTLRCQYIYDVVSVTRSMEL
jgi:hypothetical protein